jgi:hydroxymethylpyrimidine pyrophosphatase-like HAD family hydrolase
MSSPYRLLALDLDGTLLDRQGNVSARDRAAIASLQARGVVVTINTGRLVAGTIATARACDIRGPVGCCDGSHLYDVSRQATVSHHPITDEDCRLLDELLADPALTRYVFSTERAFCDGAGRRYADYVHAWSPELTEVGHLSELARASWRAHPALGQLVLGPPSTIAAAMAAIGIQLGGLHAVQFSLNSFFPDTQAMLVRTRGPTKGTALDALCAHHDISLEESVVVGDWWNDVPMFQVAGRSFAMPAAPGEVKAAASDPLFDSTASIAHVIERCWPS